MGGRSGNGTAGARVPVSRRDTEIDGTGYRGLKPTATLPVSRCDTRDWPRICRRPGGLSRALVRPG